MKKLIAILALSITLIAGIVISCKKLEKVPAVTTGEVSLANATVTATGTVVEIGEGNTTAHGFCWATHITPTIADNKLSLGKATKTGIYQSEIPGLTPNTTYYLRAYISAPDDTKYGSVQSFIAPATIPTITTTSISSITQTTASSGGTITDAGGATITSKGVCWSTSQNPTTANSNTNDGTGTGSFTSSLTGLLANTTYYVRAYATNSEGTAYGTQVNFTTLTASCPSTVTDIDGNTYNAVQIGNQCWMAENLKVTKFPSGSSIPLVTDNTAWANLANNDTDDAFCYYNNNANGEADTYGALYTWAAAMGDNAVSSNNNPSGVQGVCPTGWHLPSDAEWTELTDSLGGESVAGGKMKEAGTAHWNSPNTGATNSSGFSALPGGYRNYDGAFFSVGNGGYWWTATQYDASNAWIRYLGYGYAPVNRSINYKAYGFSVRCVKD